MIFFKKINEKLYFEEYLEDVNLFESIFAKVDFNFKNLNLEKLTKNSQKIINYLKNNRTIILKGPAGHGKSYTLNQVATFLLSNNIKVKLICPTWKSIEIYENNIESSTIKGLETKNDFFKDIDFLVIDEMSLIKEWNFLKFIKNNTRIIIAGDDNQLPPIGSNIKKYKWLIEIANKKSNKNVIDLKEEKNWRIENTVNDHIGYIQKKFIDESFDHKKVYKGVEYVSQYSKLFQKLKKLSEDKFTIITNKNSGIMGVDFLNRFLKPKNNENFQVGDEIVFFRNNKSNKYYNGLFGKIKDINENIYTIETKKMDKIVIAEDLINDLPFSYSYAINAHKSQGSTLKKVVVLVNGYAGYDWLYTAYSRASDDAKIIFHTNNFRILKRDDQNEKKMEF